MHSHAPAQLPKNLPPLDEQSAEHAQRVEAYLIEQINRCNDGFMPFDKWMDLALYAPGLGYYTAGSHKLGANAGQGDFTTAPELSPLFGQTLAKQVTEILHASHSTTVLEFGAGSGALAASIIPALHQQGIKLNYQILELSPDLRQRQQQRLAGLSAKIEWLDALPTSFSGCVLANEVLDAMPVKLFEWDDNKQLHELGVVVTAAAGENSANTQLPFGLASRQANASLQQLVKQRMTPQAGYRSEINLRAEAWVKQMGTWLTRGAALLIDYGFPQAEYYHPQRDAGTLMCHFRHRAHSEPLVYAGLQDITAHIDFTAMADAALAGQLQVLGYTSQARFLLNLGITEELAKLDPNHPNYAKNVAPLQQLLSEAEMGELFKVLAIGKNIDIMLAGFSQGDRRHRLA